MMENCFLTHLMFVDDVLILLNGSIGDTSALQHVFELFQKETCMIINIHKSTLTAVGCSQLEVQYTLRHFPFALQPLEDGLKYLGFRLKPSGYKIADWTWLISKVENRLHTWYNRYLSRAGRLTLIKAVLEATLVY